MNKINIYSFDECDYVASPWGVAETQKWYQELTGAGEEEPELVDQKTKGFWDEVPMEEVKGKVITGNKVFGNYGYVGNTICIYRSTPCLLLCLSS